MSLYEVAILLETIFSCLERLLHESTFDGGEKPEYLGKKQLKLSPHKITEVGGANSSLTPCSFVREHPGMDLQSYFSTFHQNLQL